jgi:catechol 2,3-dioxygenase-like lactoylglutathione lyase family enzyme|tara:strand:- start:755 stop:1198 length:444 start_codon:yes stop_codon:yes gene_type:complete
LLTARSIQNKKDIMNTEFTKPGFDLGIVTSNGDAMLEFYRDVIGLKFEASINMEKLGIQFMHRLWAGESLLKIVVPTAEISDGPTGGMMGSTGLRYFTLSVANVQPVLDACTEAKARIIWERREARPGVWVGMVEDPDGNWVEFIER